MQKNKAIDLGIEALKKQRQGIAPLANTFKQTKGQIGRAGTVSG